VKKDQITAMGNTYKNLVKFGLWFLRYASKQTDRQTDTHTETDRLQYFAVYTPTGDEVTATITMKI